MDLTATNNTFFFKRVLGSPGLLLCGTNGSEKEEPNTEITGERC